MPSSAVVGAVTLGGVLCVVLQLYALVIIVRALLSWFPADHGPLAAAERVTWQLTEPLLAPMRRVLPLVRLGGLGLDLAPIIALIGIWLLSGLICR